MYHTRSLSDKESTDAALKDKTELCVKENGKLNELITSLQVRTEIDLFLWPAFFTRTCVF